MNPRVSNLMLSVAAGAVAGGIQYALDAVRPGQPIVWSAVVVYFIVGALLWLVGHELGYQLPSPAQQALIDGLTRLIAPLASRLNGHAAPTPLPTAAGVGAAPVPVVTPVQLTDQGTAATSAMPPITMVVPFTPTTPPAPPPAPEKPPTP